MKPVLKEIKWSKKFNEATGEVVIGIPEISKTEEYLNYEDGMYHASTYTRGNNELFCSICIIPEKPCDHVVLSGLFNYERNLIKSQETENLWYVQPCWSWSDEYNTYVLEMPQFGLNQCGHFRAKAYKDKIYTESCDIYVHPSLLTDEEYFQMEIEIKAISEQLMSPLTQIANSGEDKEALLDIDSIKEKIYDLTEIIRLISLSPLETLSAENIKMSFEHVKKPDYRILVEHAINPLGKVNGKINVSSFDTREHRIVKKAINDLIIVCKNHRCIEESLAISTANEFEKITNILSQKLSTDDRRKFEKRINHLSLQKDKISCRLSTWNNVVSHLNNMACMPFLNHCKEEVWSDTHVFRFHPLYQQLYTRVESIRYELCQTSELLSFQQDLIRSPDLYEKWVFFKVLHFLINVLRFRVNNETLTGQIMYYYNKLKTLEKLEIELFNDDMKIVVINEPSFDNGKIKPDISLKFYKNMNESDCSISFLDAKFKPYNKMEKQLEIDIKRSAVRYKDAVKSDGFKHRIAFLAHPDAEKGSDLNYSNFYHQIGYILLKPGADAENHIGLGLYFKIMVHYFLQWEICPACGSSHTRIKTNHLGHKTHYYCTCSMFWVKNICWNRNTHPSSFKHLYKYADWNIHKEDKENMDWDVFCPICNKSYGCYIKSLNNSKG